MATTTAPETTIIPSFRFSVLFLVGGVQPQPIDIRFQRVSGLSLNISTQSLSEGGQNLYVHQLPNAVEHGNLVLERGRMLLSPIDIVHWTGFNLFEFMPSNIIVTLQGEQGEPLAAWIFLKAYPVSWATSDLDATKAEVLIDSLELTYSKMWQLKI